MATKTKRRYAEDDLDTDALREAVGEALDNAGHGELLEVARILGVVEGDDGSDADDMDEATDTYEQGAKPGRRGPGPASKANPRDKQDAETFSERQKRVGEAGKVRAHYRKFSEQFRGADLTEREFVKAFHTAHRANRELTAADFLRAGRASGAN